MPGYGKSVTGRIRKTNEDSILVENGRIGALPNLFIVADGMGGHKAGEIASLMAIKSIREFLMQTTDDDSLLDTLSNAVVSANENVFKSGISEPERFGMGTTLLAVTVSGNNAYIVNVGDSRLYALNPGKEKIEQITVDHSFVMELLRHGKITAAEAASHPKKNMITRALGIELSVKCDTFTFEIAEGDILLMCSDGLTNMLSDNEILNICNSETSLEKMLQKLLVNANEKGGTDNISVILYAPGDM